MAGSHLNNVYPDFQAHDRPRNLNRTPWIAIVLGLIVGAGLAVAPFVLLPNFHHSPYLDRIALSMGIFVSGTFWAIVELKRGRLRHAVGTALLGFVTADIFWFQTGRTFLQVYSASLTRALDHLGK